MEVKTTDVIIPFHPQYLPKHAPLTLQGEGGQRGGSWWPKTIIFSLLMFEFKFLWHWFGCDGITKRYCLLAINPFRVVVYNLLQCFPRFSSNISEEQ